MSVGYGIAVVGGGIFIALVGRVLFALVRDQAWLPPEFSAARLLYSERQFLAREPFPIVVRIDRGYLVDGQLHLVELKTRSVAEVFESDVIELSAQRLAILASTGMDVSMRGLVVIEDSSRRRRLVRRVQLMDEEEVARIASRRRAILDGRERPRETQCASRCIACEYRSECKGEAGARVHPLVRK